ncbi:helix-turn-helix transcriptional regulator [Angustibacter sp. McL0619]|uniref:helix-turn-helix transcriptional regulator n=1 Tax=Angustibacter sp. McL0619 TaxID=3415676 RepID=UPI003CF34AA8
MSTDVMARILDLVSQAMNEPSTTGADLADRAYLSRFHFARLVTAAMGEPPGALRRRLLLERAAFRLLSTQLSVLDVGVEAGYGSHEAFTRAFAREYGRSPTQLRREPPRTFHQLELPCPSGVHFQPPGGLRLPATHEETSMDVLQQLVVHHVDSLNAILDRAERLDETVLDQPIVVSVETIDGEQTLRSLINAMVTQEEHWLSALRGGGWPDESDQSVPGLRARHEVAGRDYLAMVDETIREGRLADTFVDTTCGPPTTHTLGGTIGHVITFAAVRRTLAVGALETAGIPDLGAADPRPFLDDVGGQQA